MCLRAQGGALEGHGCQAGDVWVVRGFRGVSGPGEMVRAGALGVCVGGGAGSTGVQGLGGSWSGSPTTEPSPGPGSTSTIKRLGSQ